MSAPEEFKAGFAYVLRDWASGLTWEESVDLATTPADKRSQAFCDGARAAAEALGGWLDEARKKARAHGIPELEREELIARARAA